MTLQQFWDESLDGNLEPEIKGRIIAVKSEMNTLNCFYGVTILQVVWRNSDNLSKTFQKSCLISSQRIKNVDLELRQ